MTLTHIGSLAGAVMIAATAASAHAADLKLAIVYDGSKFDRSFSQSASDGVERFKKETGTTVLEAQVSNTTQSEQVLRSLARKNVDMIAVISFAQAQAVQTVAAEFPKVKFVLIDGIATGPNIKSVLFKEEEGSYLAGVAAALATKSKKIGFIGGMDIPMIRAFGCGYAQGAKAVDAKVELTQNMVGTTSAAWNDPARGGELARSQFERGVDVVFGAAGGTGLGILQTAKEKNRLAIGVNSNQNYLYPGTMLTSMMKRVDNAVYSSFTELKNGRFQAGTTSMGLKEGGVDWALDKDNRGLISDSAEKRINTAKQDIISGKIKVVDYRAANSCPV
ncbi:BMP family protein [Undibacterium sp.]|uniref:BMP family lipoprotein n=1 Tax=Undibacterium sp. TaxID=1914977 RepID=UPI00374CAE4C